MENQFCTLSILLITIVAYDKNCYDRYKLLKQHAEI